MKKQTKKRSSEKLIEEYKEMFKNHFVTTPIKEEWRHPGDFFRKLSIYEDYTPVKTSGSTELTRDI